MVGCGGFGVGLQWVGMSFLETSGHLLGREFTARIEMWFGALLGGGRGGAIPCDPRH